MANEDILINLVDVPRIFKNGDNSMFELLNETGYFGVADEISDEDIYKILARKPDLVSEWISYSEDKRTLSGWYIKQENSSTFEVGYISKEGGKATKLIFSDRIRACAAFIKHELENIWRHSDPGSSV